MSLNSNTQDLNEILDTMNNLPLGGGGLRQIGQMIDESGVLESTEGTVEEKVEQVIDYANFKNIIQESLYGLGSDYITIFKNTSVADVSMFDFSAIKPFYNAFRNTEIENLDIDVSAGTSYQFLCANSKKLKKVILKNMNNTYYRINGLFTGCSALEYVETLNFCNVTQTNTNTSDHPFSQCSSLKEVRFVENCISSNISFGWSPLLSAESIQNIIDALATVSTAQTLTLHKDIVLTDEQKSTINSKGWTLVQ